MKNLKSLRYVFLLALLMLAFGCQTTGESDINPSFHDLSPEKVALVEVFGDQRYLAEINEIEDVFVDEMQEKGYTVLPRMVVEEELDKHDFEITDKIDDHKAAQIGDLLDTHAVTILEVHIDDDIVSVAGRMVESGDTEVIWSGSSRGGSSGIMSSVGETIMGSAIDHASQSVPAAGGEGGRIAREVATDVASEAGEQALSQEDAQVLQDVVQNLVKDLPQAQ